MLWRAWDWPGTLPQAALHFRIFVGKQTYQYSDKFLRNFRSKEQSAIVEFQMSAVDTVTGSPKQSWTSNWEGRPPAVFLPVLTFCVWQHLVPGQGRLVQAEFSVSRQLNGVAGEVQEVFKER